MTATITFEQRIMRRRTTALAARRINPNVAKTERVLFFRMGEERYALGVEFLAGVFPAGKITPVPGTGAAFLGLCMVRGVIRPVIDLAVCIGLDATPQIGRFLLLNTNALPIVLAVSGVEGVGDVRTDNLAKCPDGKIKPGMILGIIFHGEDDVLVFNGPELTARIFSIEER